MRKLIELVPLAIAVGLTVEVFKSAIPYLPLIWLCVSVYYLYDFLKNPRILSFAARLKSRFTEKKLMYSYLLVFVGLGGLGMLYWWGLNSIFASRIAKYEAEQKPQINDGISVDFGAFFLNMSQDIHSSLGWWGVYDSGATASPITLVIRMTITNIGDVPENIGHYSLAVKTQECGSIYLTPIDPRAVPQVVVVSKSLGFSKVPIFEFVSNGLAEKLKQPLLPHTPVQGWMLFDTPTACPTTNGSTVSFRLELQSLSGGPPFTSTSENKVLSDEIPGTTTGDVYPAELHAVGGWLDLSHARKKVWHE